MRIKPNKDKQIIDKLDEFDRLGGCIQFKVFNVDSPATSYQTHLEIAKRTLIKIAKESEDYFQRVAKEYNTDRNRYFKQINYFEKLENSGVKITIREFLGPQFDLETNKPLIKGVKRLYNAYFYYDTEEDEKNIVDIDEITEQFDFKDSDGISGAFCGAFLEPPYSLRIEKNILKRGQYFLDFCKILFSDFTEIEIYKWSVDCSTYFDDGKEWWGSHFWTVYNPIKSVYIGIVASTTD